MVVEAQAKVPPPTGMPKSSPGHTPMCTVAVGANACCAVPYSTTNTVLRLLPLGDYGGGSVEATGKGWNSDWPVAAERVSIARR